MSETGVPHFRNDAGVSTIAIGAKAFMCTGATHPFDHPHIFLDMGREDSTLCPYCSTRYTYNPELAKEASDPAECAYRPGEAV
jgi:uncharacterized Zn-finger protein